MRLCSASGYPERVITITLLPAPFSEQDHVSSSAGQIVTYKALSFRIALKAMWELQPGQNTAAFLLTGTPCPTCARAGLSGCWGLWKNLSLKAETKQRCWGCLFLCAQPQQLSAEVFWLSVPESSCSLAFGWLPRWTISSRACCCAEGQLMPFHAMLKSPFSFSPSSSSQRVLQLSSASHHVIGCPGICTHIWHAKGWLPTFGHSSLSWQLSVAYICYQLDHSWSTWTFVFASLHSWCHSMCHPWPLSYCLASVSLNSQLPSGQLPQHVFPYLTERSSQAAQSDSRSYLPRQSAQSNLRHWATFEQASTPPSVALHIAQQKLYSPCKWLSYAWGSPRSVPLQLLGCFLVKQIERVWWHLKCSGF